MTFSDHGSNKGAGSGETNQEKSQLPKEDKMAMRKELLGLGKSEEAATKV